MEDTNIFAVIIALIAGLTGSQAWTFWQKKAELKREEAYSYKTECKYRIDKLEDELNKAEQENKQLSQKILELSILIAQLTTRIDLMESGVGTQHTGL
jgi:predicted negative regulator of RcsB-dependent stress response